MPAVVVDTDVVSYLFKGDSRAELYRPHLTGQLLTISFMTVAELEFWAQRTGWGRQRRARLAAHLESYVMYSAHRSLCRMWATVVDAGRRSGRPIHSEDAWIAATALLQDIPLVTHNARDYRHVDGLRLISATPSK